MQAQELVEEFKRMSKMMQGLKGMKMPKRGGMSPLAQQQNLAQMQKALPPQLLQQFGGPQGLQQLMRQMEGGGGGNMAALMKQMGMG